MGLAIVVVEGETGETLSDFSFVAGMDIEGVAEIAGDGHINVGECFGNATLTVTEPRPAGTVDAGELDEVEGKGGVLPVLAPGVNEE